MPLRDYQTALVTGASSGIGEATVKALTKQGLAVHALARRRDHLQALADQYGCTPLVLDLRDRDAIHEKLSDLEIDVLVNNAGAGSGIDGLWQASPDDIDLTLETNVQSLVHMLRAVVPGMIDRRHGHIVNIGSVAGLYPINSVIYGASKGAVHLLNQNLRIELRGSGVRATEICPGRVRTAFFDNAITDPAKATRVKDTGIEELEPEDIAHAIVFALDAPRRMNVSTIEIQPTEQSFGGATFSPLA